VPSLKLVGGSLLRLACLAVPLSVAAPQVAADSYLEYLTCKARERLDTLAGLATPSQERAVIATCYALYRNQHRQSAFLGQPALGGMFPIADLSLGDSALLTFQFIDPVNELPIDGPAIGSVLYEINTDPNTPDVFSPIGMSFDAGTHFALPFTMTEFEPDIQAVPFDQLGKPIVLVGQDGFNVAVGSVVTFQYRPQDRFRCWPPQQWVSLAR
jgi:hypothetical protein